MSETNVCPICGTATWNYNTASGTRMCSSGHQTDKDGNEVPFTATYTPSPVPVTVEPPTIIERVVVQKLGWRLPATGLAAGVLGAGIVEVLTRSFG